MVLIDELRPSGPYHDNRCSLFDLSSV